MKYMENEKLNEISSELSEAVLKDSHRVIHGRIEAYTMKRAGTDKKYAHALGQKYVAEIEDMQEELAATVERKRRRRSNSESILTTKRSGRKTIDLRGPLNKKSKKSFFDDSSLSSSKKETTRSRSRSFDCTLDSISPKTTLGDFSEISTRKLMTDLILTLNASFPDYDFSNIKPNQFEKVKIVDVRRNIRQNLSEYASQRTSPNFFEELWNAVNDVIDLKECTVYSFDYEFVEDDDDSANNSLWNFHYLFVNKSIRRIVFFTCSEKISDELMLGGQQSHEEVDDSTERIEYYRRDSLHTPVDDVDWDPSDNIAGGMSLEVTIGG